MFAWKLLYTQGTCKEPFITRMMLKFPQLTLRESFMAASASQSEVDETVASAAAANGDAEVSEADNSNGQPVAAAAEEEKETPADSRPPSPLRKRCETDWMRPGPCNSAPGIA